MKNEVKMFVVFALLSICLSAVAYAETGPLEGIGQVGIPQPTPMPPAVSPLTPYVRPGMVAFQYCIDNCLESRDRCLDQAYDGSLPQYQSCIAVGHPVAYCLDASMRYCRSQWMTCSENCLQSFWYE